jgi:hypothetical protein
MKSLITFRIAESHSIQIIIDQQNKINTYGYSAEGLHVFDEVEVQYIHNGTAILLTKDIVQYVVETFCASLEMSLKNELPLDASLVVGKVGCFFSKKKYMTADECNGQKKDDVFTQYWVWSSPDNIQTWLYNRDNKIYFEISPTYPWLFSDPQEDEHYITFDDYIKSYEPVMLIELSKSLVQEWVNQCHKLLDKMETV